MPMQRQSGPRKSGRGSLRRRLARAAVLACLMWAVCSVSANAGLDSIDRTDVPVLSQENIPTDEVDPETGRRRERVRAFLVLPFVKVLTLASELGLLPEANLFFKDVELELLPNTVPLTFKVVDGTLLPPGESPETKNVFDASTGILRTAGALINNGAVGPVCFKQIENSARFVFKRLNDVIEVERQGRSGDPGDFEIDIVALNDGAGLTKPAEVRILAPFSGREVSGGEISVTGQIRDESCEADSVTVTVTQEGSEGVVVIDSRTVEIGREPIENILNQDLFETAVTVRGPATLGDEPIQNVITVTTPRTAGQPPGTAQVTVTVFANAEEQPTVTITSPEEGALVTSEMVAVEGTVTDPRGPVAGTVRITVNDEAMADAVITDGIFSAEVSLVVGENDITVVATTTDGRIGVNQVFVTREDADEEEPGLSPVPDFTVEPATEDVPIISGVVLIRGAVENSSEGLRLVVITVNGVERSVGIGADGNFESFAFLQPGVNTITTIALGPGMLSTDSVTQTVEIPTTPIVMITSVTEFGGSVPVVLDDATMSGSTSASVIRLEGVVYPSINVLTTLDFFMRITVSESDVDLNAGIFGTGWASNVFLQAGSNTITVTAMTTDGDSGSATIRVIREDEMTQ